MHPSSAYAEVIAKYVSDLRSRANDTRLRAVEALGSSGAKSALPELAQVLENEDVDEVRLTIRWAVREIGLHNAEYRSFIELLRNPKAEVRLVVLDCLLSYDADQPLTRDVSRLVIPLLADEHRLVRTTAAVFLAGLKRGVLKSAFESRGGDRAAANYMLLSGDLMPTLGSILFLAEYSSEVPEAAFTDSRPAVRLAAVVASSKCGITLLPWLCRMLGDPDPAIRESVALTLGHIGHPSVTSCLHTCLKDSDPKVRFRALIALGTVYQSNSMQTLACLPSLLPKEESVRVPHDGDHQYEVTSETLSVIAACLRDSVPEVRVGACEAIGMLGRKATPILPNALDALRDPDPTVRWRAATAIGTIQPRSREAIQQLVAIVRDDGLNEVSMWIRRAVINVLAGLLPPGNEFSIEDVSRFMTLDESALIQEVNARLDGLTQMEA